MSEPLLSVEQPLRRLAAAIKHEWESGEHPPDARAAFDLHPELLAAQSVCIDLAYEEYCRRLERGEAVHVPEFCARFPRFHSVLLRLMETHDGLGDLPDLFTDLPLPWPEAGEEVAGFRILRELGRGAFSRVYLATETSAGDRPVALKLTFEGGAEACILGRLPHPNVVHVNSAGVDERTGLTRLCMPFLGAATLHDLLRRAFPADNSPPPARAAVILDAVVDRSLPDDPPPHVEPMAVTSPEVLQTGTYPEGVAELGRQLADALASVHRAGVFHHDLKPTNVLLGPGGRPVLLDFNLSQDSCFAAARLGGTLPYMAPEQARAVEGGTDPAGLDGRADQFSLAVLLYELLTGRLPFGPLARDLPPRKGCPALLAAQERGYVPVRQLNPAVRPELARVVERCLALRPEDRHPDADALARALGNYLARARPAPRRPRRWVYAACAALLAGGCVTAGVWWSHSSAVPTAPAVRPANVDPPETPDSLFQAGRERMLAGDDLKAILSFQRAEEMRKEQKLPPDGLTLACLSYCTTRSGQHGAAMNFAAQARTAGLKRGFETAAVFNNEGMAHLRWGMDLEKAYDAFSRAIGCDENLPEPFCNRAEVYLKQQSSLKAEQRAPRLKAAREDINRALNLGGPTAERHYKAALLDLYAREYGTAVDHFREAVNRGLPKPLLNAELIPHPELKGNKDFAELIERAGAPPAFTMPSGLVDPVRKAD
jgi:serine/threonine protein kinase